MMRWIASQLAGLITRRRPDQLARDGHPSGLHAKGVQGGFSLQSGASREGETPGREDQGLTWSFQSAPVASRIFKIDAGQLRAARAARDSGESWETISRRVNPDYDSLSRLEQNFYRRALEMAVNEDPGSSPGADTSPRE